MLHILRHLLNGALIRAALVLVPALLPVGAQTLQGDLSPYDHPEYAGIASHFQIANATVDGQTAFNGTAIILCSDFQGTSLDEDPDPYSSPVSLGFAGLDDMDVWNRYSAPQNEGLVKAQVGWLVDNYYQSHFLSPVNDASARQYAFQNVIWEVFYDGGTAEGLNWSTGRLDRDKFADTGQYGPELWSYMNQLLDAVDTSGVTASYQSTLPIYSALDSRSGYQDYVLLTADIGYSNIPEPGTALLALLGLPFVLRRIVPSGFFSAGRSALPGDTTSASVSIPISSWSAAASSIEVGSYRSMQAEIPESCRGTIWAPSPRYTL